MSNLNAFLYVVATPIGNLEDMNPRAARVLAEAELVVAEDTRHSGQLLRHFGIRIRIEALHEHNEREKVPALIESLRSGRSVALVSDAGTPLVSDPGYRLVRAAHEAGVRVVPVPGACAAVAALSAAGLPCDRFAFEGFPPPKATARRAFYEALRAEPRTLVFYEAPHRIADSLADLAAAFGPERPAVFARELTKQFETVRAGALGTLHDWVRGDPDQQRGEIVLVVEGAAPAPADAVTPEAERVLTLLLAELAPSRAAELAAKITGSSRRTLYERALQIQGRRRQ